MDESITFELIIFIILISASGFFSGMEIALTSLSSVNIQRIKDMGGYRARLMEQWSHHPGRVLTGILIGNNLVNIGAATIASAITLHLSKKINIDEATALAISTGIVTFLVLILGEITPKTFAKQNPIVSVKLISTPLVWFLSIFKIPAIILTKIATVIIYLLGGESNKNLSQITEDDIRDMIRMGEMEGVIAEKERKIIHSAIDIRDLPVNKIMTPRLDIVAIRYDATIRELIELMTKTKYSRIPIYVDDLDNVIGIAYLKHVLNFLLHGSEKMQVMECITLTVQVPETKSINELLVELQTHKNQMAIVFDEYGQTSGLITMEDILEELVGDIRDEYEEDKPLIVPQSNNQFVVDCKIEITQINEILGINLPSENFNTLAGWVNWVFGKIPKRFEKLISPENIKIKVLEIKRNKVEKVSLTFPTDQEYNYFMKSQNKPENF